MLTHHALPPPALLMNNHTVTRRIRLVFRTIKAHLLSTTDQSKNTQYKSRYNIKSWHCSMMSSRWLFVVERGRMRLTLVLGWGSCVVWDVFPQPFAAFYSHIYSLLLQAVF